MKIIFTLAILVFTTSGFIAQQEWCGTDKIQQQLKLNNPGFAEHMHKSMSKASAGSSIRNKATLYLPVVVHIIHDNGIGNISDDQVEDALRVLNLDYNRMNTDANSTRNTLDAPFVPVAGDMKVEFKLAKKDPDGNCTNGIVRVNAPELSVNADDDCKFSSNGGSDQWPMDQYLNIWVVNSISSDGAGTTLGYAYLPYWPNGANYGILIRNDSFGTIETAFSADGRTLTHEMGHLLGLQHIFDAGWSGSSGCHADDCFQNGDYCCDTPPQEEANWSCSPTWNSCSEVPSNDLFGFDALDQIENYMSYNACQNMFSFDQVDIMLQNFQDISFLASMVTPENTLATGINDVNILCNAEFGASKISICANETVVFSDYSYHGASSWNWNISPGTAGLDWQYVNGTSQTSQNPEIQFMTQGYYTISLNVSDGTASTTEEKTNFIAVLPSYFSVPFWEGFEAYSSLDNVPNWSVFNPGGNNSFVVATNTGYSGTKCTVLQNYNQSGINADELISAPIDLSSIDPISETVTISFRYAYRKRNAVNDEWFKVFISNDCGDNWAQRKTLHGDQLSPLVATTSFTPGSQTDWTTAHMTNVTSNYFTEDFRMKFRFEGNGGNNIFIDDINIYSGDPSESLVLGIAELGDIAELSVFPNPAEGSLNVRFAVDVPQEMVLLIRDLSGKIIEQYKIQAQTGANIAMIDTQKFASGMYLLSIQNGTIDRTVQFAVK